jgi:hypothetical protein
MIDLPADCQPATAKTVVIEIRDASLADAPSIVVASRRIHDVVLKPSGTVRTQLTLPDGISGGQTTLIVRAFVSMDGSEQIKPGDLLTTSFNTLPVDVDNPTVSFPVQRI